MYLTAHSSKGFYPSGQKWGGSTSAPQPGAILPARTHYHLTGFRPNQAMARGMIPGVGTRPTRLGCACSPQMGSSIVGDRRRRSMSGLRGIGLHGLGQYTYASALATINASPNIVSSPDGTMIQDYNSGLVMDPVSGEIFEPDGTSLGKGPATPNSSASTPTSFIPAGTEFIYQAQRQAGFVLAAGNTAQITSYIQANSDLVVDNLSTSTGTNPTITIYCHSQSDHAQLSDIKGILDGAMQQLGRQIQASQIAIVKSGAPALAPTSISSTAGSIGSWLTNNWPLLAVGGAAWVLLRGRL